MTIRSGNSNGFTLVEMIMVVAVLGIVFAMAVGITPSFIASAKSDSSVTAAMAAVELARDRAIGERRDFLLTFTTPNKIQVSRVEVSGTIVVGTTMVMNTVLDNGMTYMRFTGVPDTPDAFGGTGAIAFGTTPTIEFTSDGSLLDSSGDPVNGTVFFGDPARTSSARALTIFGATGLVNVWKWDGLKWVH